ncbi:MAG: hypothetical protein UU37_C0003G0003 [Candidatus Gottesmanbacteria bacterium GW2011_GWA2_41_12]|nr:MAG: hypothetical protein UU37_C0003G0003 [Candidatus Gottesmanbacteria bacterium GW2011_GWA2_41_12]
MYRPSPGVEIPTFKCLESVFSNILSLATSLAGLALFVMLIIGGVKYMTSGGDAKASESAKNTMTYAVVGLLLIVSAFIIFKLIASFTGVDSILIFKLPGY